MLILIIEKRVNLITLLQKLESLYQNTFNKFDIIYFTNLLSQYRNPCSVNEYLKGIPPQICNTMFLYWWHSEQISSHKVERTYFRIWCSSLCIVSPGVWEWNYSNSLTWRDEVCLNDCKIFMRKGLQMNNNFFFSGMFDLVKSYFHLEFIIYDKPHNASLPINTI